MRHLFSPHFSITPHILNDLAKIEVIRDKIRTCPIAPKEEYRLKHEAIISMIHHSTAIEGNTLNELEVARVLRGKRVLASPREIYEVRNYKKALDFIAKRKTAQITPKDILKLHTLVSKNILPKNRTGAFRKEPVYVVSRTPISQEIRYTAPPFQKVPALVQALCNWINDSREKKLSPILIAGIAHAEIAAIHPFIDGNGRTARLLATLILYTEKYDFRKLFALENYYNTNRRSYYDAIHLGKTYRERAANNLTNWLEYFVRGFLAEMQLVMDKIEPFRRLKKGQKKVILSKQELQILDFLQEVQSATSKDMEEILSVNRRQIQRYLIKLIRKKLIKKQGGRKNAVYVIK